eukprot:217809-Prymnesium_polylepis.1
MQLFNLFTITKVHFDGRNTNICGRACHGQKWSILRTHRPSIRQQCARSGLYMFGLLFRQMRRVPSCLVSRVCSWGRKAPTSLSSAPTIHESENSPRLRKYCTCHADETKRKQHVEGNSISLSEGMSACLGAMKHGKQDICREHE